MVKKIFRLLALALPVVLTAIGYFSVPGEIVLPENARYSAYPSGWVRLSSDEGVKISTDAIGTSRIRAELFGAVPIKTVEISVVPQRYVSPSGAAIGVRLYADGVLVVETERGSAARAAGLKKSDVITKLNGENVYNVETLSAAITTQEQNTLTFRRGSIEQSVILRGEKDGQVYRAGMWIRDSAAGIGTMSYIDSDSGTFGALGHAICDADTGDIVPLASGSIADCKITSVRRGTDGEPGELMGSIGKEVFATVEKNCEFGIYGRLLGSTDTQQIPIATRFLVREGPAIVRCDVGDGIQDYTAEIEQISKSKKPDNKSIVIRITDSRLIARTGGIVQGMSGAPILQNGKLIGALTHVFVNDPTRGYGIFIENMLEESTNIK